MIENRISLDFDFFLLILEISKKVFQFVNYQAFIIHTYAICVNFLNVNILNLKVIKESTSFLSVRARLF